MAGKKGLVKTDVLYSNYSLACLIINDPIYQKKWVSVRQNRLDLIYVQ